jgi:hypothetical protein
MPPTNSARGWGMLGSFIGLDANVNGNGRWSTIDKA